MNKGGSAMSKKTEEPLYIELHKNSLKGENGIELQDDIRKLCESELFGVLATQGKGITHASLISFAISNDLKYIVFATPINTGKFNLIAAEENISVLVDDRSSHKDSINEISALTIIGKGKILSDENEIFKWASLLTEKHPNLNTFVKASSTAIILLEVGRYLYVKKFQEMTEWDLR